MTNVDHVAVLARFTELERALLDENLESFHALCASDAPPQDHVFTRNARQLKARGHRLEPERVELVSRVAHVHFVLRDPAGSAVDKGAVTFSLESDGWRLRRL